jgi:hypothetical protein
MPAAMDMSEPFSAIQSLKEDTDEPLIVHAGDFTFQARFRSNWRRRRLPRFARRCR